MPNRREFDYNWITPLGPNVDGFESEMYKQIRGLK